MREFILWAAIGVILFGLVACEGLRIKKREEQEQLLDSNDNTQTNQHID